MYNRMHSARRRFEVRMHVRNMSDRDAAEVTLAIADEPRQPKEKKELKVLKQQQKVEINQQLKVIRKKVKIKNLLKRKNK